MHWLAMNEQMPIGDEFFDYLFANVCLMIAQAAGLKKGKPRKPGPNDFTIEDFLVFNRKPKNPGAELRKSLAHLVVKQKDK